MEPVTLALAAVGLLVRYGAPLIQPTAEKVVDELGAALAEPLVGLLDTVRTRTSQDDYASGALTRWEGERDSPLRQATLQDALAELVAKDEAFAARLQALVTSASEAETEMLGRVSQTTDDAGAVAGRDFTQNAKYAAGRDQNFGAPPA